MQGPFDKFSHSSFSGDVSVTLSLMGTFERRPPARSEAHASPVSGGGSVRGQLVQSLVCLADLAAGKQTKPTQQFLKTLSNPLLFGFTFLFLGRIQHMLHHMHLPKSFFLYLHISMKLKIARC